MKSMRRGRQLLYVVGSFGILLLTASLFFSRYRIGAFTVDDPGLIAYLGDGTRSTSDKIFKNISANRWRPFADLNYVLAFTVLGKSFAAWSFYSTVLLSLTGGVLFATARLLGASTLVASALSVLLVTSRFVHYQVMTATGLMEAWALLTFAFLVLVGVMVVQRPTRTNHISLTLCFWILVLTHERFQSLAPALILLLCLKREVPLRARGTWTALLMLAPITLFGVKQVFLDMPFFVGVGSATDLGFTGTSTTQHINQFVLHLLGLNVGEVWFSGLVVGAQPASTLILAVLAMLIFWGMVGAVLQTPRKLESVSRSENAQLVMVGVVALACLMAPAVATSRLELRWISSSYLLTLVFFGGLTSRLFRDSAGTKWVARAWLTVMLFFSISMNVDYRNESDRVFFRASQPGTLAALDVLLPAYSRAVEIDAPIYVVDALERPDVGAGLSFLVSVHSDLKLPTLVQLVSVDHIPLNDKDPIVILMAEDGSVSEGS